AVQSQVFFFSSRRRHTRFSRDWSSDVCSSDLAVSESTLPWGRRYLMCPPRHFGVLYEINPWMRTEVTVDSDTAFAQWERLVDALHAAGAQVEIMPSQPGLPDLVFTANAGIVDATPDGSGRPGRFVPSHFRHPERQPETAVDIDWFARRGWK